MKPELIKWVSTSRTPWDNPSLDVFQQVYNQFFPNYPTTLDLKDPLCSSVRKSVLSPHNHSHLQFGQLLGSLSTFRNRIKEAAETATRTHIETVVLKRFKTPAARSKHIKEMFEYNLKCDHDPFLWRRWEVTNIPTGYKKPHQTKGAATKTTNRIKSTRVVAQASGPSKSEYCIVTTVAAVSSVWQSADHLSAASFRLFRCSPHY